MREKKTLETSNIIIIYDHKHNGKGKVFKRASYLLGAREVGI